MFVLAVCQYDRRVVSIRPCVGSEVRTSGCSGVRVARGSSSLPKFVGSGQLFL